MQDLVRSCKVFSGYLPFGNDAIVIQGDVDYNHVLLPQRLLQGMCIVCLIVVTSKYPGTLY